MSAALKGENRLNMTLRAMYSRQSDATKAATDASKKAKEGTNTQKQNAAKRKSLKSSEASEEKVTPASKRKRVSEAEHYDAKSRGPSVSASSSSMQFEPTKPSIKLGDLGLAPSLVDSILSLIALPVLHPEVFKRTGVSPPRGILLHGPPGCGKTSLAEALAGELDIPLFVVAAPSLVSGMSGETERAIRQLFENAKKKAPCLVMLDEIDAITPKRESAQREMERRIVAQLLTCMDELDWAKNNHRAVIVLGATNRPDSLDPALRRAGRFDREIIMSVPDEKCRAQILQVLARKMGLNGDFDFELLAKLTPGYVGADLGALATEAGVIAVQRIFSEIEARASTESKEPEEIASALNTVIGNDQNVDDESEKITSSICSSFELAADGESLETADNKEESSTVAEIVNPEAKEIMQSKTNTDDLIKRVVKYNVLPSFPDNSESTVIRFFKVNAGGLPSDVLNRIQLTNEDFIGALKIVQPSSKREGFATVPGVKWEEIGALADVREELRMAMVDPIQHPERYARVGLVAPEGVLLWGPPGCGKTLLAKAVANESHSNFISVKGPELLNKYVGESERAVRLVFARARASAPCVIFFDEIDALVPKRDDTGTEAVARVVNTMLTELDGLECRARVYVLAATNRPDILDPAMLRPGRLGRLLYVGLPGESERVEILRTVTRSTPLFSDVDLGVVGAKAVGFSGADLAALVREAAHCALREDAVLSGNVNCNELFVCQRHFDAALQRSHPSVSAQDQKVYDELADKRRSHRTDASP